MPNWKWHILLNSVVLIFWIWVLLNFGFLDDYVLLILLVFFNSFLTVFPDIDSTKSGIRDFFAVLIACILLIYVMYKFSVESIVYLFLSFIFLYLFFKFFPTKHRGITHKFWFSLIPSFIFVLILWFMFGFGLIEFFVYFLFILSGYLSHIFIDWLF